MYITDFFYQIKMLLNNLKETNTKSKLNVF